VKFGRKTRPVQSEGTAEAPETAGTAAPAPPPGPGPHDIADVDVENDGIERIDLGGLLVRPGAGLELRLQVDESSGAVQSVLVVSSEGAVELRAFAAPRSGDLWEDVRRQIAAETSRKGGTATEREGRHGPELQCVVSVRTPDGKTATQPSRVVGINGPRWFLRATYLGKPAVEPEAAGPWEDTVADVVVRRGEGAMAPGDPLPITLPPEARRVS